MTTETRIRVLIACDFAHPSDVLLSRLPQLLGVEQLDLTGLYVEDEDLLRAAELPGLSEVSAAGELVRLEIGQLRRDLTEQANAIRHAFEELALRLRATHQFVQARGRLADEISRAAAQADFLLISRPLRASGLRTRAGSQFSGVARQPVTALLVNEPWQSGSSIVTLYPASAPAVETALNVARRFARAEQLPVVALVPASQAAAARTALSDVRVVPVSDWTEDGIATACARQDARLLVLPAQSPGEALDTSELLTRLVDRLPCSLLRLA
ncbi:MAG: hypothetical protein R3E86_20590 [Pseudomonadales bacterium]